MSEFHVEVVRIGPCEKHPNADTLSITQIHGGYPVCFRTGEYETGDLAVYVPVDAVVPEGDPRWEFLQGARRIKAKRLRGIFSMGLLTPVEPGWDEGENVQERLHIEKYEPAVHVQAGSSADDEANPIDLPVYTDIEGWRRHKYAILDGEEVTITEKIHGETFRAMHEGSRLWIGSRTRVKALGRYLDRDDFLRMCDVLGLDVAPDLYRGPWSANLISLAEGRSTLDPSHVREGIVIKPVRERWDGHLGRVILKYVGEGFLLKQG